MGLGSNLGDRISFLQSAVQRLGEEFLEEMRISSVFESEPWGIKSQPKFLNLVVRGRSEWKPPAIVNYLKNLERELGRKSGIVNGPREIDLDLLIYGERVWDSEGVRVPHPRLGERTFVLLPLVEVWPDWRHPESHRTSSELSEALAKNPPSASKRIGPLQPGTATPSLQ